MPPEPACGQMHKGLRTNQAPGSGGQRTRPLWWVVTLASQINQARGFTGPFPPLPLNCWQGTVTPGHCGLSLVLLLSTTWERLAALSTWSSVWICSPAVRDAFWAGRGNVVLISWEGKSWYRKKNICAEAYYSWLCRVTLVSPNVNLWIVF